ncbi:matrix metalloproteinase-14-like isoform X1 [Clavelina lepadiformis]|uniref:matrix metalloproteinase-14-like isoform X1 n=2 Tax=Clavelina lepadiformis TaxID=159417 RepID=UPI0040412DBB
MNIMNPKFSICTRLISTFVLLLLYVQLAISFHLKLKNDISEDANNDVHARAKRAADIAFGKTYLTKYGYVPPENLVSAGGVARQTSMREAIMEMQAFMGLKKTGELDEATLAVMRKSRCANSDKGAIEVNFRRKKRYVTVGQKWQKRYITYSINNVTPKLGKKLTHEAIDQAFAVWSKHIPIEFDKVSPSDKPDIVTFFADGYHDDNTAFDGPGGYLAHAYYPGPGIGGDTHFDSSEPWTLHKPPYEGNDLFLVAVHELGHALGLGHSPDQTAIMAPIYQYHNTENFVLPQDDINGIQNIYGVRYSRPEKPIKPTSTTPPTSTLSTTSTKFYPFRTKWPSRTKVPPTSRPTPRTTTKPPLPEVCKLKKFDAVSYLRRELYIFSGKYMWRRRLHDDKVQGPYKITSFWPQLKDGVTAVYENPATNRIVFFKDYQYWEYDGTTLLPGSPRHVRFLGLQNDHVGAAVWWERNGKTYFFQNENYWRFSGDKVESDYPKRIDVWKGVPANVDAAFSGVSRDGRNHTYFVKGNRYWTFHNYDIRVVSGPQSFRRDWLGCGSVGDDFDKDDASDEYNSTSVGAIVGVCAVAVILIIAAVMYIVRRRQRAEKQNPRTVAVASPTVPYAQGYSKGLPPHTTGGKTMCVTAAQQKLRRFHFSLQPRV